MELAVPIQNLLQTLNLKFIQGLSAVPTGSQL